MNYKPEYFTIQEWVPEHIFKERGEKAWWMIDAYLLKSYDALRKRHGPGQAGR